VNTVDAAGGKTTSQNIIDTGDVSSIESALTLAQEEVIEQEIFSMLVTESSRLPTASARVSERLIVIEVATGVELRFELVRLCWLLARPVNTYDHFAG
jgi:mediator of RNA polymerase II transcription subunit 17